MLTQDNAVYMARANFNELVASCLHVTFTSIRKNPLTLGCSYGANCINVCVCVRACAYMWVLVMNLVDAVVQ